VILEANGAGVALLDLQSDGDLDVVFAQGLASLAELTRGPGADLEVFLNDGHGRFTRARGPGLSGWWTGLATGDVDGDGDADLVAGGYGDLVLCLQDASGQLVPQRPSGLEPRAAWAWTTSVALFDADRDGQLDVYACQYLELDPARPPLGALGSGSLAVPCRWKGLPVFCGPVGLRPQRDRFLRGHGDGTFEEAGASALIDQVPGLRAGGAALRRRRRRRHRPVRGQRQRAQPALDQRRHGRFPTSAASRPASSLSGDGRAQAGMGRARRRRRPRRAGRLRRDELLGRADRALPRQRRGFARATHRYGLQRETRRLLKWSAHLVDLDGDGWLELIETNGHVYPEADQPGTGTSYRQPLSAWHLGPGAVCTPLAGQGPQSLFARATGGRGSALGDVDGDGAPDLVVARIDAACALGMNRLGRASHRLVLRCIGPRARSADAPRTPADAHGHARRARVRPRGRGARPLGRGPDRAGLPVGLDALAALRPGRERALRGAAHLLALGARRERSRPGAPIGASSCARARV
jgi:hypothetical protein